MIQSTAFDYINILDKAADASWTRESLIAGNIANVDTPEYKRKDLNFEDLLQRELGHMKYESLDQKVRHMDVSRLQPEIYTDAENYSYRMDKNNVDIDTEQVELASEQIRYQALIKAVNSDFERMRSVLK